MFALRHKQPASVPEQHMNWRGNPGINRQQVMGAVWTAEAGLACAKSDLQLLGRGSNATK